MVGRQPTRTGARLAERFRNEPLPAPPPPPPRPAGVAGGATPAASTPPMPPRGAALPGSPPTGYAGEAAPVIALPPQRASVSRPALAVLLGVVLVGAITCAAVLDLAKKNEPGAARGKEPGQLQPRTHLPYVTSRPLVVPGAGGRVATKRSGDRIVLGRPALHVEPPPAGAADIAR